MALIEWRDDFRTGIPAIDYEHESLIALLNDLYAKLGGDASDDQIQDFLGEVLAQIAAHFALEERMMRDVGYDRYQDHKDDHDRLLDEIRDIMDRHFDDGYEAYGDELASHLRNWFVGHFKTRDARLHAITG